MKFNSDYLIILLVCTAGYSIFILDQIKTTKTVYSRYNQEYIQDLNKRQTTKVKLKKQEIKPKKIEAKGVYLTARSASADWKLNRIIYLLNNTQLNTVVIDIKHYTGKVLYDSDVKLVNKLGLEKNRLGDVEEIIEKLHKNDIYVIARQSVFQDPALAEAKPSFALKNKKGKVWKNKNGISWSNPANKKVWEYNISIAKEAASLGFDEINFDYVRFPSDGDTSRIRPKLSIQEKQQIIANFFDYIKEEMKYEPVRTSLDLFGMVMESPEGLRIGQNLKYAVNEVDYISPMMYPSHYPEGHIGIKKPSENPKKILENGLKQGQKYFKGSKAELRPWIQAFSLYSKYDRDKIQDQINTVEKYTDAGWILWNARNVYRKEDIKQ
ncbi:MAG: putative glycoside hydrolase [Candidatus Magasanikbacteria bacterium]